MVDQKVIAMWLRDTDRPPLAPGDCLSWSILTQGTLLEGTPWPGLAGTVSSGADH